MASTNSYLSSGKSQWWNHFNRELYDNICNIRFMRMMDIHKPEVKVAIGISKSIHPDGVVINYPQGIKSGMLITRIMK